MNYYPFHLGDYATHTAHLEPMEDLAYRRLLDLYYLRESPLPADVSEVARLIRLRANVAEVETILREFFTLTDEGWFSERCHDELLRMLDRQAKAQASAQASVAARKARAEQSRSSGEAGAERTLNDRSTTVELPTPTPTPTPVNTNTGASAKRVKPAALVKPEAVSESVWADFLTVRKAKKAPLTQTALDGIAREAEKAGMDLAGALAMCCARGWQGFKADWVAKSGVKPMVAMPQALSFAERDELARRKRWEEMTGRKWPENDGAAVIDVTPTTLELGQ
jgi:uncharacterized protein YdaU (DUF1376 family)